MAFAGDGKVVYGKAFDALRISDGDPIDFFDLRNVEARLEDIVLYEIKSTRRELPDDFRGYFFSISTAELLVAQSLGNQYRFAFVNTLNGAILDVSLQQLFQRAARIYPTWSITLGSPPSP